MNRVLEIERKFILRNMPKEMAKITPYEIEQYYTPLEEGVIRYRQTTTPFGVDFEKIIKIPIAKGTCTEQTFNVDEDTFKKERQKDAKHIEKNRYTLWHGSHKFEVDVFKHMSLVMLEIEVKDLKEELYLPSWLQKEILVEVTGMKEFSNYNMATV